VLGDGQGREHGLAARHLDDAHRRRLHGVGMGDVAAFEEDRAADRVDHAGDGLQERRLAGTVRAQQGDALAGAHLEVDAEEDLHLVVGDLDAAAGEQRALAGVLGGGDAGLGHERGVRLVGVAADVLAGAGVAQAGHGEEQGQERDPDSVAPLLADAGDDRRHDDGADPDPRHEPAERLRPQPRRRHRRAQRQRVGVEAGAGEADEEHRGDRQADPRARCHEQQGAADRQQGAAAEQGEPGEVGVHDRLRRQP
jgi:hypothetical protein